VNPFKYSLWKAAILMLPFGAFWGRWVIENVSLVECNPIYMIAFLQLGSLFAHLPQTVRPCSDFWSGNGGELMEEMKMTASEKREDKYACTKKL
jgi:hypothetical protein